MIVKLHRTARFQTALALSALVFSVFAHSQTPPPAHLTGLEVGNNLNHVTLKGHVKITCEDYLVGATSEFDCTKDTLEPFTLSRFQTDIAYDADHFDLKMAHENSWSRYKSGEYLPSSGTSDASLNLWNSSIFDLPILDDGVNKGTYQLSKRGLVVAQGSFLVNVTHSTRTCPAATLVSHERSDCRYRSYACDRYFFQSDNCQN